jgi:hypothetical protein
MGETLAPKSENAGYPQPSEMNRQIVRTDPLSESQFEAHLNLTRRIGAGKGAETAGSNRGTKTRGVNPSGETREKEQGCRWMIIRCHSSACRSKSCSDGEAQAGSAGEQPAEE